MKRSEMVETIASELIHELTGFMAWNKALMMADIVLARIEKEGMLPPTAQIMRKDYYETGHEFLDFANEWER